jgi:hypothetical protein
MGWVHADGGKSRLKFLYSAADFFLSLMGARSRWKRPFDFPILTRRRLPQPVFAKKLLTGSPHAHNVVRGLVGDVCAVEVYLTPGALEIPFEIGPQL